jgi:threonine/homoserine/homoserine lactone efflux protein
VTSALIALVTGVVLIWLGARHWRYRRHETVSMIEAAILKSSGDEPLPLTPFDWFLKYAQAILGFVFGLFFAGVGAVMILTELDWL